MKLAKNMVYSESAFFGFNLERKIRFEYPTKIFDNISFEVDDEALNSVIIECRYSGYLEKEEGIVREQKRLEDKLLPEDIDYSSIRALRIEARQKLDKVRPLNLGQASRISGVSPADIAVLIVYLQKYGK